jgi:hypothetical protein
MIVFIDCFDPRLAHEYGETYPVKTLKPER